MITLATFGPNFDLPDASPFVVKTMIMLKMAGLEFSQEADFGKFRQAPKGKLPYIVDEGDVVADSYFIRQHIERKYGLDFDAGLDARERATAHAVEKMLEESQYWVTVYNRWIEPENWPIVKAAFFAKMPFALRYIVPVVAQRTVRRNLHGQGLGRHSRDEIYAIGARNLGALADILGDRPYLMGDTMCGADASVLATLVSSSSPAFRSPMRDVIESRSNLVAYRNRLSAQYL